MQDAYALLISVTREFLGNDPHKMLFESSLKIEANNVRVINLITLAAFMFTLEK